MLWCNASERDPTLIEAQLEHLDYDLRNAYHKIGEQLNAATTHDEARTIFAPYVDAEWILEGKSGCSLRQRHELTHLRPTLASSISAFHMSQLLLANRFVLGFLLTKIGT
jgi:hypothetical protein